MTRPAHTRGVGERVRPPLRWLLAIAMVWIGVLHFVDPDPFVAIVPPYLPWPLALVWISGAFEVLLGIALLVPRTRRLAGLGLVALYVAVFPANVHMAIDGAPPGFGPVPEWALWARLPLQAVFIAWALWVSRPTTTDQSAAAAVD